jgi:Xaa-Pro aminopeptidase
LYRVVMTSIKVHMTPAEVIAAAIPKMDAIMASYKFTDPKIEKAAKAFVENYRRQTTDARALGHSVGLEVHDPGVTPGSRLEPGRIFTIEPQMRIEEDHIGIRLENIILMTETGYENLSEFVPIEIDAIEKLMAAKGLSDAALKLK